MEKAHANGRGQRFADDDGGLGGPGISFGGLPIDRAISAEIVARLHPLGAWDSRGATPATRKRIIRTLIHEIIVRVREEALDLVIHWQRGDHTRCR